MRRLTVYCGSGLGNEMMYADAARALGVAMAARGIGLVYGGGRMGLMGIIADAVLERGGDVVGVIPEALLNLEVAHTGLTKLQIVRTMHERKARMTELTDAFVALPGGVGTLDELFEAWSWNALGYHSKPFGVINVGGFWDKLIAFIDDAVAAGFISPARRAQLIVAREVGSALDQLAEAAAQAGPPGMTW